MNHEPKLSGYKVCSRCEVEQPVINFGVDRDNRDGLSSCCRECKRSKERDRYTKNKPKRKKYRFTST